jgi:hypothetical protein
VTNRWNQDDEINYSHALARRLPAEALYDAIHRATGTVTHLSGMPAGLRAVQQLDSNVEVPSGFLDLFGRPPRESACECERSGSMMLGPVLNLVNGPILADAIKDPANRISKLVATEKNDTRIVEELFFSILCRPPTEEELAAGLRALQGSAEEYARLVAEHDQIQAEVAAYEQQLAARQAEWEKKARDWNWTVLELTSANAAKGTILTKQADGSLLASGKNPSPETYTITANTPLSGITGIRLEVLSDASLPAKGPGRAPNGNFVLNEFRVTAAAADDPDKPKPVALQNAKADLSQEGYSVAGAIDGNPDTGWAIAPATGKSHVAVFEIKEPVEFAKGATLTFTLDQRYEGKEHNIGRLRLSVTTAKVPIPLEGVDDAIAKILAVDPERRTAEQQAELTRHYRSTDKEWVRLGQALAAHPKPLNQRLLGAQDLAWALLNSPAFLFNH